MAWSGSGVFRQWIADSLAPTASFVGKWNGTDVFKAALFNNTPVPDKTVAAAASAYNTGVWVLANEVTDPNWPAGGQTVTGTGSGGGFTSATNLITFGGANTAGAGNVSVANVYGDLLYDSTVTVPVSKQGAAFHSFGGVQTVTAGTFTIIWNVNGLMQITF